MPAEPPPGEESVGRDRLRVRACGSLDRVPSDPSSPWTWSAPLLALGRTPVRIHSSFLALVLLQALRVIRPGPSGPLPDAMAQMLVAMVTLAWLALLADAAREWASRRCGASGGTMVIWPAGGLSWREPQGPWSTRLAVSLAGPVATACLSMALAAALALHCGRWDAGIPSPWSMDGLAHVASDRMWSTLWLVQWTNVALLVASCIPAHPFPGGRALESVLEPWLGRDGAMRATLVLGIVAGAVLLIAGLALGSLLALLCGAVAVGVGMAGGRLARLRPGMSGLGIWSMVAADASEASRARSAVRAARQAREDDAALDGILSKVAQRGIDSLTREERAVLVRTTARRRASGGADGGAELPSSDAPRRDDGEEPAAP